MRPSFGAAWNKFLEIRVDVSDVGNKIGGKVQDNISSGIFQNACPIRMSYVLNYTGISIPLRDKYKVVSGGDKKYYIYRVNDMVDFLKSRFGKPDIIVQNPQPDSFYGKQGIIVFEGVGWSNAVGHVTLWNGNVCSDDCHFIGSPDNGTFVPSKASLWILK